MNVEFMQALEELVKDRGIDKEVLLETIEQALTSAYKKNFGSAQNVRIDLNRETGDIKVYSQRVVVDEQDLYDNFLEIELSEAREISPNYELGDIIEHEVTPMDFGRIAAQTAKQIVVQKIREAEREMTYNEFIEKQDELITGEISRTSQRDGKCIVFAQIGKGEGVLLASEQIRGEEYKIGTNMKFYVVDVNKTSKNPQILLSRSHTGLVKRLFEMEVPEIQDGTVQIKSISREAGSRTKMAVLSTDENIDPIGACVGTQGSRVRNIVDELGDEKIDIVKYSDDIGQFVEASLSPSKVTKVFINEKEKSAVVIVPDYQLSLAIGKEGQNARLAARLTNWKIDIKPESDFTEEDERALLEKIASDKLAVEEEKASKELAEENPAEDMDEEVALESSEEAMEPADIEVAEEILSDGEVEETSGDQA
ncbi:transcription termination factor NusA [Peptostreptococcus anaerobius]|uniref:transcription termination factor NusA n=1 Tax=Peptostreptococcus anaerobius TaxID=1261 RepID=UPI001D063D6B|nr:transcription termination factor NusA [Peptostreptococcus anaerobius]MCB6982379.1 transcription termination factor NusA [Peptostreptococcus anaerobius]MCQ5150429.1 transcription termination factor NusA [Peptostreptococcus anaerobius]MDK8278523.1 transcription termination factor NusA [Peptostreptococcus anaerobius]